MIIKILFFFSSTIIGALKGLNSKKNYGTENGFENMVSGTEYVICVGGLVVGHF